MNLRESDATLRSRWALRAPLARFGRLDSAYPTPGFDTLNAQSNTPRRIAVIGGGITGLAAAHRLLELEPGLQVTLFESADRLGGVLRTRRQQGYLLELSADNFVTNVPWAVDLCRRLGLTDELIETSKQWRRALVVRNGKLYPVPEGFMLLAPARLWPLLTTRILSPWGKLRLFGEFWIPPRRGATDSVTDDESLASFAVRRLGRETFERLVQPLVSGIYTADAEKLSLAAALPQFLEMERQHGGLIRAVRRQKAAAKQAGRQASGARYSLFVTLRHGLESLVGALAERLSGQTVRLNSPVDTIATRPEGGWSVSTRGAEAAEQFDGVIVALRATSAASLLRSVDEKLSDDLGKIPYAGTAMVLVGYDQKQIAHPMDGFGFVVPEVERRNILAGSFSSRKYPGRAPAGHALIRVFLGGGSHPELVDLDDNRLRQIVTAELAELLGIEGQPDLFQINRWQGAMPQYHVGHLQRVRQIEERTARLGGLQLAGNAYHGVGIPHCIHSGEQAAERILQTAP